MEDEEFIIIRENMKSMLKYSKLEYAEYKKTKEIIYLQQAGEKLFSAIENHIESIYQIKVESFKELMRVAKKKELRDMLYEGRNLHRFFYNGLNEYDETTAETKYKKLLKRLETKVR